MENSGSASNPQTLQQQLSQLQTVLIDLEARYTDDHPDVIKTKADIAQIKKKLDEVNNAPIHRRPVRKIRNSAAVSALRS